METMLPLTTDVPPKNIPGARPAVVPTVRIAEPLVADPPLIG
jgi:hypothetical protein